MLDRAEFQPSPELQDSKAQFPHMENGDILALKSQGDGEDQLSDVHRERT